MSSRQHLVTAAIVLWAGEAAAITDAVLSVSATSGYTDNALGTTDDVDARSDVFFTVSPALNVTTETRRLVLRSSAGVSLSRYIQESQANSITTAGSLALEYDLSKTFHSVVATQVSYLDVSALPAQGTADAVPVGGARFLSAGLQLGLAKDFSAKLRGTQELQGNLHVPIDDEGQRRGVSVQYGTAAQVSLARDAFEARLTAGADLYEAIGMEAEGTTVYKVGLTAGWFHELSPSWGTLVTAGAAALVVGDAFSVEPLATASITHRRDDASFHFQLAQGLRTNQLVAETFVTSSATVGADVRFGPRDSLGLSGGAGASRGSPVGDSGGDPFTSVQGSAQLAWEAFEGMALTLSYQAVYQVTDDEMLGDQQIVRNSVLAGLTASWPQPRTRSRPLGILLRVRQSEERDRELRERGERL